MRAATLHPELTARAAAAECVAAAAATLTHHWATWALLQAGANASETPAADRIAALLDGGATNLLTEDPQNARSAFRALEALDAALATWTNLAGLAPARTTQAPA